MASNFAEKIIAHIAQSGCDDVLSKPFFNDRWDESLLIDPDWQEYLRVQIGAALTQNPVAISPLCHVAVPKGRYTFRSISHMSLTDTLKYTALVFSIGDKIESNRLKKDTVFSNRFEKYSCRLDRSNYDKFREKSKELSNSDRYKIKVITDLANFYDRLNLHKLENLLYQIGCDSTAVKKINDILVTWSNQQSFGLPVGSDASRLLAEAMLINADKELHSHRIRFIRYVDDYRIFCRSQHDAYEAMQLLDAALRKEGLFLNSGKTKLVDLARDEGEEGEAANTFERIDEDERVEKTKLVRTRYSSRIAKYYKYPGKEAIKELQKIDLVSEFKDCLDPNVSEDRLKRYVKASIYSSNPNFSSLVNLVEYFPHLVPYVVDAIVKEHISKTDRFSKSYIRDAVKFFRNKYQEFGRSEYFKIQSARLLCVLDDKAGEFLSKELLSKNAISEMVFAQTVYFLGSKIPRSSFIDMLTCYSRYGGVAKLSLVFILRDALVIRDEERRAWMKNLRRQELDPFLNKLLAK